jgi:ABC-2 type transport system ATP-binding protein
MLDEVEKVCTHVAILKAGELMASGKVSELSAKDNQVEVAAEKMDALERIAGGLSGLKQLRRERDKLIVSFMHPVNTGELNRYFFEKGITLTALNPRRSTMESLFLEITSRNA